MEFFFPATLVDQAITGDSRAKNLVASLLEFLKSTRVYGRAVTSRIDGDRAGAILCLGSQTMFISHPDVYLHEAI